MKLNEKKNLLFSSSCLRAFVLTSLCIAGCHSKPPPATMIAPTVTVPPENQPVSRPATRNAKADTALPVTLMPPPLRFTRAATTAPKDPRAPLQLGTQFDMFDILLPAGAVSRSEAFWKLIDEDKIDPGTYDTLRRNGIRIGVAPVSDWPSLREVMDRVPSTTHLTTATGREATNLEISLKPDIASQSLFVFLPDRTLVGRTYERCENLLTVSFAQLPRKPGQLRVAMSPVVRSTRKQLTYTPMGNEQEFQFSYLEKVMDVNLWADIPLDNLLVMSPSEEADSPCIGRAFLMRDSPAERQEHVLVMVPRMFRLEEAPAAPTGPQAALPRKR